MAFDIFDSNRFALLNQSGIDPMSQLSRFAAVFYSYPVYMYFNFSGYTDMVVAAAGLIGLRLPENFDRPYLARNMIDFWNRWHITLSHWIRDYVFMLWFKAAIERFPRRGRALGYGLLFFSLFLSGIWHGSTASYAIFGVIHGIGVAATRIYADALRLWLGRDGMKRYEKSRVAHWLANLLTLHYVGLAFVYFGSTVKDATRLLAIAGRAILALPSGWDPSRGQAFVAQALTIAASLMLVFWYRDVIVSRLDRIGRRMADRPQSLYMAVLIKSVVVALLLICLWGLEKEPEIAYMRF